MLAVGGGGVIDSAKAIGVGLAGNGRGSMRPPAPIPSTTKCSRLVWF
ncbi:MAG: hypothetical protein ACLTF5_08485 [Butyricicoccus sp.]